MLWKYIQVFSACLTLSYFYFTSFNVNYQHIFTQINKLFFKCLPIEDKQDVVHIHNRLLLRHEKEQNNIICNNMNGLRYFHTEWIKSKRERQTSYGITYLWNLKYNAHELIYQTETDKDIENRLVDAQRSGGNGEGKVEGFGMSRCKLL